jgi:hypothetical protein
MSAYVYPWPASALTPADMRALHAVRESCSPRVRITDLIAHAVRQVYSQQAETTPELRVLPHPETNQPLKEAA